MAYIGNNPKLKSIVSSGDTLANLTAETRKAGRLVYATDTFKYYVDDGTNLTEVGSGGFNAVDTKANLDALTREQGKIYYATDEDAVYTDDGSALNILGGGGGVPLLSKGGLLTSDGANNGELTYSANDGDVLVVDTAEAAGIKWAAPSGGGAANYVLTPSCGTFSKNNTTQTVITNLSATITTNGGPVRVALVGGAGGSGDRVNINTSGSTAATWLKRDSTYLFYGTANNSNGTCLMPEAIDTPPAGTYTYTAVGALVIGTNTAFWTNYRLLVQEL